MEIKLTRPEDRLSKGCGISDGLLTEELIEKIESKLIKMTKDEIYFNIEINKIYPNIVKDKVRKMYEDVGWERVTFSETIEKCMNGKGETVITFNV